MVEGIAPVVLVGWPIGRAALQGRAEAPGRIKEIYIYIYIIPSARQVYEMRDEVRARPLPLRGVRRRVDAAAAFDSGRVRERERDCGCGCVVVLVGVCVRRPPIMTAA